MTLTITQRGRTFQIRNGAITAQPSAAVLNAQKNIRELQRNVVADNAVIPIVYGQAQVGGRVFALDYDEGTGTFTVGYLVCQGEIDSFVQVWMDGEAPPAGVTINYYTGTSAQTADPLLAAAITDYDDDLPDLAYIVIQYGADVFDTWPAVVVEIKGKKVLDPRTGLTAFTKTPGLYLGDLLRSTEYGHGYTVDATDLEALADANEETIGGEARRESFLVIDDARPTEEWVETLRAYASCFLVWRGDTVHTIPDKASSSVATFTAADIVDGSLTIRKRDPSNLPTVVQVLYTDTSGNEWRERRSDEAVILGAQRRVSVVRLTGITRASQAYREAVERLNKLTLSDLETQFEVFDEGLELEVGDVITVSHPYGLTSKALRLIAPPEQDTPGRWRLTTQEYDAAAYSDEVISEPSTPDTTLPVNQPPAAVASITVGETTYQLQNGKYASRLDIAWAASTSPFVTGYQVKVYSGASVVWATTISSTSVSTSPLQEQTEYTVEVRPQTSLFVGDALTENYSIIGKTAVPDAPASLSGFEVGGEVRLSWPASTDVDAERYEVRYGNTGGSWSTATPIDVVDGLRLVTRDVPEGTWRFYVKTIDSIQQVSPGEATVDLEVTLDNDAFTAASSVPLEGTIGDMTGMHEAFESRLSEYATYYADSGESWNTLFPSAMNTYTAAMASYQTLGGTSVYLSPEIDLVSDKSGNFRVDFDIEDFGNTVTEELGVKPDGGSYSYDTQLSQQATARYTRAKASASDPFVVRGDGGAHRVNITAREEAGTDTSASGAATTVSLSRQYAAVRSITLTPEGSTALIPVYDNIQLDNGGVTSFDVYIFSAAGTQVAADFRYSFKGV